MATDYLARKSNVGLSFKSTWGSAGDIGGTLPASPQKTLLVDPNQLKPSISLVREELQLTSAAGLMAEADRSITDYSSGIHRIAVGGTVLRDQLPLFLFLSLFKATETDDTVAEPDDFQQVFVPWAETAVPDFTDPFDPASSASPNTKVPVCALIVDYMPGNNAGAQYFNDAILNTLNLSLNVNNQGIARFLNFTAEFAAANVVENANGTDSTFPTAPAIVAYNNATPFTFTLAGTVSYSGCFKTYGLSINNNVTTDCRTTGGRANNFRISPEIMVDFTIPCNDTTDTLAGGSLAGTEQTITLSTGTSLSPGYLNIVAKGALVGNLERVIENNVWVYKGQLKCEKPSSGNSLAVTVNSLTQLLVTP